MDKLDFPRPSEKMTKYIKLRTAVRYNELLHANMSESNNEILQHTIKIHQHTTTTTTTTYCALGLKR